MRNAKVGDRYQATMYIDDDESVCIESKQKNKLTAQAMVMIQQFKNAYCVIENKRTQEIIQKIKYNHPDS